jgi:predicted Zn-dependent protease
VLALRPDHADAATWIARILYDQERLEPALAAAERARDLDPYRPQPWFVLAQILFELERSEEAGAARARFAELDRVAQEARILEHRLLYEPDALPMIVRLAELSRSIGDVDGTRTALARAIALAPRDPALRIHALDVLTGLGDAEGALVCVEAMKQALPEEPAIWERLARFYAERGDRPAQVEAGERFLRFSEKASPR